MYTKQKIYFPSLNGLRAIAALMVVWHHFNFSFPLRIGLRYDDFVLGLGKIGVILFFTLSGFLITFLLLKERELNGKISIGNFYKRRILRIWPLYYFIVILSFFVLNTLPIVRIPEISSSLHDAFWTKIFYYFTILPNVAYAFDKTVPFAVQSWSIGVEEQFYLIWPLVFSSVKNSFSAVISVLVLYLFLKLGIYYWSISHPSKVSTSMQFLVNITSFSSLCIGAIAALILYYDFRKVLQVIFSNGFQIFLYLVILSAVIFDLIDGLFKFECYAILFALLILNLSSNKRVLFSLNGRIFDFLGKISFGIYMYHFLGLRLVEILAGLYPDLNYLIKVALVLFFTIVLSALSYYYFELYFIKRKLQFSTIVSGDNVIKK